MFTSQLEAQVAGKYACSVTEVRGIKRLTWISVLIEHGATQFGIVAPRAAIQIVASYGGPDVVDDTHLRVYIDGKATAVFQSVYGYPVTGCVPQGLQGIDTPYLVGRSGNLPVLIGPHRENRDHPQLRLFTQSGGECLGDVGRPEVLILDVDERTRPSESFLVRACHTALARWGERIPVPTMWVGAQDLDDVRADGRWIGTLGRQSPGLDLFAVDPIGDAPPRRS